MIRDIQQTDFFYLLRDTSDAEQYNFLIVRMTNMVVQVFPVLDCDIHDNVFGNRQYIGRGADHSDGEDGEDEDEESDVEYEDEEKEEPSSSSTTRNPYILDEVSEEEDETDVDEEDVEEEERTGGRTKDERITKYVQVRSGRNGALVSLKRTMVQKNVGRAGANAVYKKLCFLHKLHGGDWCRSCLSLVVTLMTKQYGRQRWNTILHTNITSTSNQMICLRVCT